MNTIHYTITASENTPRFGKPEPEEPRFAISVENNWTEFELPLPKKLKLSWIATRIRLKVCISSDLMSIPIKLYLSCMTKMGNTRILAKL